MAGSELSALYTVRTITRSIHLLMKLHYDYFQPVQVEIVLIILRRLAEDIHMFDSGIDQKRKKEMAAALNEKIREVFGFILQNLEVCQ